MNESNLPGTIPHFSKNVTFAIEDRGGPYYGEIVVRAEIGKGMELYTSIKRGPPSHIGLLMEGCLRDLALFIGNKAVRP